MSGILVLATFLAFFLVDRFRHGNATQYNLQAASGTQAGAGDVYLVGGEVGGPIAGDVAGYPVPALQPVREERRRAERRGSGRRTAA